MQTTSPLSEPLKNKIDIEFDPVTGQYVATLPELGLQRRGTHDEVLEWALDTLSAYHGTSADGEQPY